MLSTAFETLLDHASTSCPKNIRENSETWTVDSAETLRPPIEFSIRKGQTPLTEFSSRKKQTQFGPVFQQRAWVGNDNFIVLGNLVGAKENDFAGMQNAIFVLPMVLVYVCQNFC